MSFGDSNGGMYMPVAPVGYGGYGNGGFGMGDNGWWILVLLLALGGGWNNGWGMNGGGMFPLYQQNTNNDVQRGFDQQAVMGGINTLNSNVSNGFATTQQAICNSTAGITQAVNNGMEEYADNSYYGLSKGMSPDTYRQSYGGMSMGHPQDMRMMDRSWDSYNRSMANYENNRSNHSISDRMIASLEQQMNMAQTDYERQQILAEIKHIRENQNK